MVASPIPTCTRRKVLLSFSQLGRGQPSLSKDILADAKVVDRRIYLLYPASLRINLISQQVRALELVDALSSEEWMAGVTSVAVVGGGASGIMAAAALRTAGLRDELKVTLFESRDQLMPLQSGCHDKLLAPQIIDWPSEAAATELAALPLLGWKKALAGDVAIDVLAQFERFGVEKEVGATVRRLQEQGNGVVVEFDQAGRNQAKPFDLVIIAAGFGLEASTPGIANQTPSYWRVNPKQAPALTGNAPKRILVSGLGDGGLTDFVLFACPGLAHTRLCEQILSSADVAPLVLQIEEIEVRAWQTPTPTVDVAAAYSQLNLDAAARNLILPWLVRETELVLLTRDPDLFHRGTAPLNRLAASLVIRATELEDRGTRVRAVTGAEHLPDEAGQSVWSVAGHKFTEGFDEVVVRHGDTSRAAWDFGNPAIEAKVGELRARRSAITARPTTPALPADIAFRFETRRMGSYPTRIRITRQAGMIVWHGDLAIDEIGRLWRVPSARVQVEIDFAPIGNGAALDLAICRLLGHSEPPVEMAGQHSAAWIGLMETIRSKAGDRIRPAVPRMGTVAVDRNGTISDPDQLADRIERALDVGLLALLDDEIRRIASSPEQCPVKLHTDIISEVVAAWNGWRVEAAALGSDSVRWVLSLLGGLLDRHGRPDSWSSVRVGPRCVEDELIPAIVYHLAMRKLADGFAGPVRQPTGNVARQDAGGGIAAAHFCGSKWFRDRAGEALDINDWEKDWPGDAFAPSCLVLPARTSLFLPTNTLTQRDPARTMVAAPWDRVPVVFSSPELRQALRNGPAAAAAAFKAALAEALPNV